MQLNAESKEGLAISVLVSSREKGTINTIYSMCLGTGGDKGTA